MKPSLVPHALRRGWCAAAVSALALGLPAFVQAAPTHPGHEGPRQEMMAKHMGERMGERQDKLKTALQLKPHQEAAWNAYATARQPAKPMERPDPQAWSRLNTPQRLDKLQALQAEREAQRQRVAEATRQLYAGLNADQQKVFDQLGPLAEMRGPFGLGAGRGGMRPAHFHGTHAPDQHNPRARAQPPRS